jgi:hypothetical protein
LKSDGDADGDGGVDRSGERDEASSCRASVRVCENVDGVLSETTGEDSDRGLTSFDIARAPVTQNVSVIVISCDSARQ